MSGIQDRQFSRAVDNNYPIKTVKSEGSALFESALARMASHFQGRIWTLNLTNEDKIGIGLGVAGVVVVVTFAILASQGMLNLPHTSLTASHSLNKWDIMAMLGSGLAASLLAIGSYKAWEYIREHTLSKPIQMDPIQQNDGPVYEGL